ncbi:hypothetical protein ACI79C_23295 [Geodermatophilus sp. SYSU D00697]
MDVQLSAQYDLTVLRVDLDRRGRRLDDGTLGPAAVFEVWRGSDEPTVLARVRPPAAGSTDVSPEREGLADFRLPPEVLSAPLFTALDGQPLWLDLPATAEMLRMLPWERLLARLSVPVLRLPSLTLPPRDTSSPGLQVALVASSIGEEDRRDFERDLPRLIEAIASASDRPVSLHVFANQIHVEFLRGELSSRPDVQIYDPPSGRPTRDTSASRIRAAVEDPWLSWVHDRLVGVAIDHLHFYCHGDVVLDDGVLSFASTPRTTDDSYRCVGTPELLAALVGLGAWSVGFSGPRENLSPEGLRDLAYAVSDVRPGPVVLQETGADPEFRELNSALSLVWNRPPPPPPHSLATALWIDPALLYDPDPELSATAATDQVWNSVLSAATGAALSSEVTPTWVATTARVLEQAEAHLRASTTSGPGRGQDATMEALRFAVDLLEEHVRQAGRSGWEGRRSS